MAAVKSGPTPDAMAESESMIKMVASVMVGGALGTLGRYVLMGFLGQWIGGALLPAATLAVNVLGCFAMGALVEILALAWSPSPELRAFLVVGILGGFTTFSAFSLDVFYLVGRGMVLGAGAYIAASVILSLAAFFVGQSLFRAMLT